MSHRERLQIFKERLGTDGHFPMLVTTQSDIFYLTGFRGSSAYLLISQDNDLPFFFCDGRYVTQSQEEAGKLVRLIPFEKKPMEKIREVLLDQKKKTLFVEDSLSLGTHGKLFGYPLDVLPTASPVKSIRMVKSSEEIRLIERALAISEGAFRKIRCLVRPGSSEREIALELDYQLRLMGADDSAFPTIVASGERAAHPHARPSHRRIQDGDTVVFDWGARCEGYCADITRTIIAGHCPSPLGGQITALRDAQHLVEENIQEGMTGREADTLCRRELDKNGLGQYFTHGLGHGVGIDVHEEPRLSQDSETVLTEGMVVTVEPGVYFPGTGGIRLENLILIGKMKSRVLNTLPAVL